MNAPALNVSEVLVFKTNIRTDQQLEKVRAIFSRIENITHWNVDREDIDNVLRIESEKLAPGAIIKMLCDANFECEELPD